MKQIVSGKEIEQNNNNFARTPITGTQQIEGEDITLVWYDKYSINVVFKDSSHISFVLGDNPIQ